MVRAERPPVWSAWLPSPAGPEVTLAEMMLAGSMEASESEGATTRARGDVDGRAGERGGRGGRRDYDIDLGRWEPMSQRPGRGRGQSDSMSLKKDKKTF